MNGRTSLIGLRQAGLAVAALACIAWSVGADAACPNNSCQPQRPTKPGKKPEFSVRRVKEFYGGIAEKVIDAAAEEPRVAAGMAGAGTAAVAFGAASFAVRRFRRS